MFYSLRFFNYRVWFIAALVSNIGQWMQAIAQNWVVLTDLTDGDAVALGISAALQYLPPLLLVGITGWAADRFLRRRLLVVTQSALGLVALTTGILLLAGVMTLPLMYALTLVFGLATAFDSPARNAFVSDLVSVDHTANAVALNSTSFNLARMVGPAIGGAAVVTLGGGWAFIINAFAFAATLVGIAVMRRHELTMMNGGGRNRIFDGFAFVARRPDLLLVLAMTFLMAAFALNFPIIASVMALEFDIGAGGLGLLTSSYAVGAVAGALLTARRPRARLRIATIMAIVFGTASTLSAGMPTSWSFAAACVLVGFGATSFFATANGYVQTTTDAAFRGRVLAIYVAVFIGSTPFGAPALGWAASEWGARSSVVMAGAAGLLTAGIAVIWWAMIRRRGAR